MANPSPTAVPIKIRTSDRGYFKKCRQLWDLTSKMRQNFEPIQRYPAFDFGTAMHAGLQAYYEPETWGDLPVMRANALEAFEATYKKLFRLVKVGDLQFEVNVTEAIETGLQMLEYYFLWAPKHDDFKPVFVEIEFEVEIPDLPGYVYQGRIDLVVENEYGYWVVDHKTAKQFGETAWLWLDDQPASYAWALRHQLGLDVRGVIWNQLRKSPPHPPRMLNSGGFSVAKNQDTTFEVYLRTLRQHGIDPRYYNDILRYLKHNPKEFCRRVNMKYSPRAFEIIEKRIKMEAREMGNPNVQIYPSPSPMNCGGCRFFGPCLQIQDGGEPSMDNYERRS